MYAHARVSLSTTSLPPNRGKNCDCGFFDTFNYDAQFDSTRVTSLDVGTRFSIPRWPRWVGGGGGEMNGRAGSLLKGHGVGYVRPEPHITST